MKDFKTERYYVYGVKGNMDGVEFFRYFVCNLETGGFSYLNPDAHIAVFESAESLEYDNANILYSDVPAKMFGEIFSGYQKFLQMPVFFWNDDESLSDKCRNELLGIGARFCKDTDHETRWFNEEDCNVYKLGDHQEK